MEKRCFQCDGMLQEKSEEIDIIYRTAVGIIPSLYCVCTNCGTEQVTPWQAKANKDQTLRFQAMVNNWFKEVEQDW